MKNTKFTVVIALAIIGIGAFLAFSEEITVYRPNLKLHPGAIDITKTAKILCGKGYTTKKVRPPVAYTDSLKLKEMKDENLPGKPSDYELDHEISLEIGGNPTDPKNLWLQFYCSPQTAKKTCFGAREKDQVEDWEHKQVCLAQKRGDAAGQLRLKQAQEEIVTDWFKVYQEMKGMKTIGRQSANDKPVEPSVKNINMTNTKCLDQDCE